MCYFSQALGTKVPDAAPITSRTAATMTTETARHTPDRGTRALVRAAVVTTAVGLVTTVVAAFVGGRDAAAGALIGTLLTVAVFVFGSFTVHVVARVMPAAALLVALLTYVLQVVVMGLVFVAISRSGQLDHGIDRSWLAGTIIAGTMVWLLVQVVLETTRRIPAYDLPAEPVATGVAGPSASHPEGGEG